MSNSGRKSYDFSNAVSLPVKFKLPPTRFERVKAYPNAILPERATTDSVGYDMFCAKTTVVEPHTIALIPTGVKCYLKNWTRSWLMLALRSSAPRKKGLMLANGVGVIDADYVDNEDNEGHIMIQVYNFTDKAVTVAEGERIAQGIVMPMMTLQEDNTTGASRNGGFGSTK